MILARPLRLERADHAPTTGANSTPDPRTGRRSRMASLNPRPAEIRRTGTEMARRGNGQDDDRLAVRAGVGVLHPLPVGRVRHRLVRAGTLLGPDSREPGRHRLRRPARDRTDDSDAGRRPRADRPLRRQHPLRPDPLDCDAHFDRHRLPPGERHPKWSRPSRGEPGRAAERDIYASYVNELFLTAPRTQHGGRDRLPVQPRRRTLAVSRRAAACLRRRSRSSRK